MDDAHEMKPAAARQSRSRRLIRALSRAFPAVLVLFTLIVLGAWQVKYKDELTHTIRYLGHADPCSYAVIARSLFEGRGFDVDYITFHFVAYDRGVTHREDHWPVLMPILMAGMFKILGDAPWVARLTSFGVASLLLPLATMWLGFAYSRRASVALVAGLLMLCNLHMFGASMETYSDILAAVCVTAFCAAVVGTRDRRWMHVVAGLTAASCFYAKGSLLLMVGIYPVAAVLINGFGVVRTKWLWIGIFMGVLGVAPWLISSWRQYGNPLFCTQNYVGGYFGLDSYEACSWTPTWGKGAPPPPKVTDRWTKYGDKYERATRGNAQAMTTWAILGFVDAQSWLDLGPPGGWVYDRLRVPPDPASKKPPSPDPAPAWRPIQSWQDPVQMFGGVAGVLLFAALLLAGVVRLVVNIFMRLRSRKSTSAPPKQSAEPLTGSNLDSNAYDKLIVQSFIAPKLPTAPMTTAAQRDLEAREEPPAKVASVPPAPKVARATVWPRLLGATMAIFLILGIQWAFVIFFWSVQGRFALIFFPAAAVLGCAALMRVVELPAFLFAPRLVPGVDRILSPLIAIGVLVIGATCGPTLRGYHQMYARIDRYPYTDKSVEFPKGADRIRAFLPKDAVLMTRHPWEMVYFTGLRSVVTPYASPADIFSICKYYRVTHYVADCYRAGMDQYTTGHHPGLIHEEGAPGGVFKLDYSHLPDSGLAGVNDDPTTALSTQPTKP